jgi:hypothetical protein
MIKAVLLPVVIIGGCVLIVYAIYHVIKEGKF